MPNEVKGPKSKFTVVLEYRASAVVEVEARSEEEAVLLADERSRATAALFLDDAAVMDGFTSELDEEESDEEDEEELDEEEEDE